MLTKYFYIFQISLSCLMITYASEAGRSLRVNCIPLTVTRESAAK